VRHRSLSGNDRSRQRARRVQTVQVPPPTLSPEAVRARLVEAGCLAPDEEARELIAAASDDEALGVFLARRENGEPLAWITGTLDFCGTELHIDPGVYVPRAHSEELARRAAALLPPYGTAADLCTGSGAIAHHLMTAVPTATVVGIDIDRIALSCARRNGVLVLAGDLGGALRSMAFDVVTAVAPYVPTAELRFLPRDVQRHEPSFALDGGADGLAAVRRIVRCASRLLRPGGWLLLELGDSQEEAVEPLLAPAFAATVTWADQDGELRGLAARATGERAVEEQS
jgi:release factor glutamine methyltransferase